MRPGVRIQPGRNGVDSRRWQVVLTLGTLYWIAELLMIVPAPISGVYGRPASVAGVSGTSPTAPGGMKNSDSQAPTLPAPSIAARRSTNVGGPFGSQAGSSARDQCTRPGLLTALAKSAASPAASSWPFLP